MCPMSPRLLRPRATGFHPEAQDWRNRVITNGGTVSGSTLKAVSNFCRSIDAAGLRDRFFRLNLFCGNSDSALNAVRTPLYRGQSRTGTQFGNATDTNVSFVAGDYAETGASGGLTAGVGKRLNTGLNQTDVGVASCHLSVYEAAKSTGAFQTRIGSRTSSLTHEHTLTSFNPGASMAYGIDSSAGVRRAATTSYSEAGAFWLGSNLSSTASTLYKNGTSIATGSPLARTAQALAYFVFELNESGSASDSMTSGRLAAYSIGLGMTDSQAAAFNTAMQAFQTALSRNV